MDRRNFLKTSVVGAVSLCGFDRLATSAEPAGRDECRLSTESWVREPARKIPVIASASVVVVGGGPAGVSAAICAARQGADVILLEKNAFLGGLWTGGLVLPVLSTYGLSRDGEWKMVIDGIKGDIISRLLDIGMVVNEYDPTPDPEACKYVLERMCVESGVRIIYGCAATAVTMSSNRIESVIVETKSGRVAVAGDFFVDASGDGDLFSWAGQDCFEMKYHIGAMWRVGGVPDDMELGTRTPVPGIRNMHIHGEDEQNGLDPLNLSRLQTEIRQSIWDRTMADRCRDGGEGIFLLDTPSMPGVRVTRVLKAIRSVTLEDSMNYRTYPDVVGMSGGSDTILYKGRKVRKSERPAWQIPYGALLPKSCPNLLVAGRCFGFDARLAWDAREIGTCLVTGQAAGTAAGMCAMKREETSLLDIASLQASLRLQNVILN